MKKPVASAVTLISLLGVTNFCAAAAPLKEMVPTGTLRVGVVEAPDAGTFFVAKDPKTHAVHGVTVDLGADLAHELGVPVTYTVFPNSGACTEATHSGAVDVAFMPVDALRRQQVAFGPGVRVVGISNTTTIRASARTLHHTVPKPIDSVQAAVEAMRSGQADALALGRDTLKPIMAQLPGSRIVPGGFQKTSISIAVPPGRPAALAYASSFLEQAKASGAVRRAFDAAGLQDEPVAAASQ